MSYYDLIPVEIESPYSGNVERNVSYLRDAMRDCLLRGEAPIASHALYTQPGVLDDEIPAERELGMEAGKAWTPFVEKVVVYVDLGLSGGMKWGIQRARELGKEIEYRVLPEWRELRCLNGHEYEDGKCVACKSSEGATRIGGVHSMRKHWGSS